MKILERELGRPRSHRKRDPLQVIVATILSQNTTDPSALKAYENLLERFPPRAGVPARRKTGEIPRDGSGRVDRVKIRMSQVADARPSPDWEAIRTACRKEIEEAVRVCGLSASKAMAIQGIIRWVFEQSGGYDLGGILRNKTIEESIKLLSGIKGVGVKTAAVTLLESLGKDICPVDTHVHRICRRLGIVSDRCGRDGCFFQLLGIVPAGAGYSLHHNFLTLGRTICTARRPKCTICPLQKECDWHMENYARQEKIVNE